jgi:hypothetical protein
MPRSGHKSGICEYDPPTAEVPVFAYLDSAAHPSGTTAFVTSGSMKSHTTHDVGIASAALREHFSVSQFDGGASASREGAAIVTDRASTVLSLGTDPSHSTASPDTPQRVVAYTEAAEDGIAGAAIYVEVAPHDYGERAEVTTLRFGVIADGADSNDVARDRAEKALGWINRRAQTPIGDEMFEQEAPEAHRVEATEALPKIEASIESVRPASALLDEAGRRAVRLKNPFGSYQEELAGVLSPTGRTEPAELASHIAAPPTLPATMAPQPPESNPESWTSERSWKITGISTFALPFGRTCEPGVVSVEIGPE